MIRDGGGPGLLIADRVRPWSFGGYGAPAPADPGGRVEVLTPPSIVAAITAGYRPLVHPSALGATRWAGLGAARHGADHRGVDPAHLIPVPLRSSSRS